MQSKNIEIESKLKTQEQLVEFAKMDQDDIKFRYENEIKELSNKYDALVKKSENDKKKSKNQLEMKENIIQKLFNQQKEMENESENKMKEREEKINQKANEFEKLYFKEKQENEFLEEKNKDLQEQIERLKNNQDQILEVLDIKNEDGTWGIGGSKNGAKGGDLSNNLNKSNTSIQHKIENIQNLFNKEKQNIENNFKKEKEYYLKDQANKVESISQLKEINRKLDQDNESARKTIDDLTAKLKDYKKNLDLTQEIRNHFDEELEKKIKEKIQEYEEQLNKKEEDHRTEIALLNEHSESTLNQLKKIFNDEKKRLEDKLNNQKKKFDEKTNNIINEYEEKLKEQESQQKTELENLQLAYEELEAKYNALSLDAQHQILLLSEKLLTQDNLLNEDKENLLKITKAHNQDLEKKISEFNKDRKELTEKIDSLTKEKNAINQELIKKDEVINKLNTTIKEKENEIEDSKKEYDTAIDRIIKI